MTEQNRIEPPGAPMTEQNRIEPPGALMTEQNESTGSADG